MSILILVGVANIYFLLQKDRHIMTSVEKTETDNYEEYITGELEEVNDSADRTLDEKRQIGQKQEKNSIRNQSEAESQKTDDSADAEKAASPPARQAEIDIKYWLERSIPLTFESRTETSEDIRRQYEHVVKELQQVRTHLKNGDHSQAMALLRPMMWDRSNIYREDAEWYYILALISAGNESAAIDQLNRLLRDNIHLYYFLGRELHEELVPIRDLIQRQVRSRGDRDAEGF
ncbi:MAG: hypothetical protein EA411_08465 [Saprospirales bacterium]|nr:MAG: hypothetical protein EA411_08465 [Saprospirales bacterium]